MIPEIDTLYALSIRQPWAELIVRGVKRLEIRHWEVRRRGTIVLHAGRTVDNVASAFYGFAAPYELDRGKLVGIAEIVDVYQLDRDRWFSTLDEHLVPEPFLDGAYAVVLGSVRRLEKPIRYRGKQMFFPLTKEAASEVRRYGQSKKGEQNEL